MVRYSAFVVLSCALVASAASGCGSDEGRRAQVAGRGQVGAGAGQASQSASPAVTQRDDMRTPTSGSVHIDPKIMQACGTVPEPHFAFDSADIRERAASSLGALADCFTAGPLKGKQLKLVGHADPRGETEYNLGLGQKRAGSVASFLAKQGLDQKQIQTSSRGEFDAQGVDEEGWARDRKVEIYLGE